MDKQQFDHIENSIRQAADDISIPFNETAWDKMEVKLNNEFDKDRRKIGIWWWWFSAALLIIAISGVYFYNHSSPKITAEKSISRTGAKAKAVLPSPGVTENNINSKPATGNKDNKDNKDQAAQSLHSTQVDGASSLTTANATPASEIRSSETEKHIVSSKNQPVNAIPLQHITLAKVVKPEKVSSINKPEPGNTSGKLIVVNTGKNNTGAATKHTILETEKTPVDNFSKTKAEKRKDAEQINSQDSEKSNNQVDSTGGLTSVIGTPVLDSSKKMAASDSKNNTPATNTDSIKSVNSISKKAIAIKLVNRTPKGFYFTASIAADATGVKDLITTKEMKPVYGVGVGYRLNKRFSIQTGFYAGNKVYAAGPDDYYTKPGSYIATIISAEAECYIYDIPLTVRYDLLKQKKSNVYLVSGLSSYILKKEYYDMHFLNPTGAYHHMSYTYKHNTSYFSILDFSIGYERKISDAFYIQAEPYLKVPLTGVGEGSVKLYSAGLQLGVKYQPFHKKK